MRFTEQILKSIEPVLIEYRFRIINHCNDYIKLQSDYVTIIVAYSQLEHLCTIWLGRGNDNVDKVEIDNCVLNQFFHTDLELSQVTKEVFVDNVVSLLNGVARPLLMGDLVMMESLERFDLERSKRYTDKLLEEQNIKSLNRAWEDQDYATFIRIMDQMDKGKQLPSFQHKYDIAKRKSITDDEIK